MYNYWKHKAILLHTKVCFTRSCQRFRLAASKDMCNLLKLNQNFVLKKFWNKIKHFFIVVKLNKYTKQFLNSSLYYLFYTDLINKSTSMANDDKLGNRQYKISYIVFLFTYGIWGLGSLGSNHLHWITIGDPFHRRPQDVHWRPQIWFPDSIYFTKNQFSIKILLWL